jgi:hypothetical protein
MASDSYRILSSVNSAGGALTGSVTFQINGTIGQPSPLIDPLEPPFSDSYDLYPGFWSTLLTEPLTCEDISSFAQTFGTTNLYSEYNMSCDSEPDGDIDGIDLAGFLQGY